ncbi:transcription initiation factor IIB [Candidatus Harpocratesius sp.]
MQVFHQNHIQEQIQKSYQNNYSRSLRTHSRVVPRFNNLKPKSSQNDKCCENPQITTAQGFSVCQNCGMVFDRVYENAPRRAFTQEELKNRKITEPVYSIIGPRTVIRGKTDSKGTLLEAKYQVKYSRLGKIHRSLTSSYERNLWIALPNFQRLQEKLGLPEMVIQDAIKIYQNAVKEKLTMGRSIDILLAASIFVSLKIHGIPRVVEEIIKVVDVNKKNVVKCYRLLIIKILPKMNIRVSNLDPVRYIEKFGEDLELPMRIRQDAMRLVKRAKKNGLLVEGKDPKGIAAAAIYISSHLHKNPRTQTDIAKLSHITEVTLRVRCRDLQKYCKVPKFR